MNSEEYLSYRQLISLVSRVDPYNFGPAFKEVTTSEQKRCVNKKLLRELRGLDYLNRSKLITLIRALSQEQSHTREVYKESLFRFVPLIDQVEKAVKEENLSNDLASKVFELSPEEKRDVLEFIEQKTS